MYTLKYFKFAFYLALVVITWLATSVQSEPTITTGWDKANHIIAFFTLILLADFGFSQRVDWKILVLGMIVYAVGLECIQALIPWRSFSILDIIADIIGLGLYLAIRSILWKWFAKQFNDRVD